MLCYINGNTTRRLSPSDPLVCVGLSTRSYNTLMAADVQTVGELMSCSQKRLEHIRGLGSKSIDEILDFLYHLRSYPDMKKIYPAARGNAVVLHSELPIQPAQTWEEQLTEEQRALPLGVLPLSARAYNCLRRTDCHTVGDLARLSYSDLMKIRSLGKQTADDIQNVMNTYIRQNINLAEGEETQSSAAKTCLTFLRTLFQKAPLCDLDLYNEVLHEFESAKEAGGRVSYAQLYQKPKLRQALEAMVSELLGQHPFGMEREQLLHSLPTELNVSPDVLSAIIEEMQQANKVRIVKHKICLCHMSVMDFVDKMPDGRFKGLLQLRLNGLSLREIANEYNLSQAGVRQTIFNGLANSKVKLEEDKYLPVFQRYRFTKEEFTQAFGEPEETYHYLNIKVNDPNRLPIAQYKDDASLPQELRLGILNLLHHDCVQINGEFVKRNHTSLTQFIVRTYFPDEVDLPALMTKYKQLLKNLGLDKDYKLMIHERSFISHLRAMDFLLWKPGNRCRYYDIESRNFDQLLAALKLNQYRDVEYSTRKFFLAHPELMEKYDIRDEYELHNLLRKICTGCNMQEIRFRRMPTVTFGNSDRKRQVYDVLLTHAPISQGDFLKKYDQLYGIDVNANPQYYLAPFADCCQEGIYDVRPLQDKMKEEGAYATFS